MLRCLALEYVSLAVQKRCIEMVSFPITIIFQLMTMKLIRCGATVNVTIAQVSKYSSLNTTYINFFAMFSSCTFRITVNFVTLFYHEYSIYALLKALTTRVLYLMTLSIDKILYRLWQRNKIF
jgi:hypothetical protein